MNAREHLKMIIDENASVNPGTIAAEGNEALRSLDALLADFLEASRDRLEGCACDTCKEQLERARQLGYGPEDK